MNTYTMVLVSLTVTGLLALPVAAQSSADQKEDVKILMDADGNAHDIIYTPIAQIDAKSAKRPCLLRMQAKYQSLNRDQIVAENNRLICAETIVTAMAATGKPGYTVPACIAEQQRLIARLENRNPSQLQPMLYHNACDAETTERLMSLMPAMSK